MKTTKLDKDNGFTLMPGESVRLEPVIKVGYLRDDIKWYKPWTWAIQWREATEEDLRDLTDSNKEEV